MSNEQDPKSIEETLNSMVTETQGAPNQTAQAQQQQQQPSTAPTRKGNEVFAEHSDIPPIKSVSREEYAKQELGLEIPVDAVPLPSAGLVYPEGHSLHKTTSVEFHAMTAREEDILMSRALIKKGTVITELIKSCLINKSIDVNSLLSGDRNAIMIAIRASGYGINYVPTFECPSCEFQTEFPVNLHELKIKPLTLEPIRPFENVFEFELPITKKIIHFRFLTGEEEEKTLKEIELKKKKGLQNNQLVTSRLASTIMSINGVDNFSQISKFVSYMPAGDSQALRKYIDENEPGVDMMVEFECTNPECNFVKKIHLPMGTEFFWPSSRT
jgi:hypothetical protein